MEIEKRKRQRETLDHEDPSCAAGGDEKKAMKRGEEHREEIAPKAPPSEEEVEEFFAILRRMHEAVKYFDQKGVRGRVEDGQWRAVFEAEVAAAVYEEAEVDNDIDDNKVMTITVEEDNNKGVVDINGVGGDDHLLDLNSLPKDGHGGH
ncbi:hypothetical protein CRG98_031256 [Punica granatum]|nr:hypothetical protein CRG98_031256 [Punica granatum]